jgi:hypothetical protein
MIKDKAKPNHYFYLFLVAWTINSDYALILVFWRLTKRKHLCRAIDTMELKLVYLETGFS